MRDNRGMSLVELITSIAIFGMVAAAALSMILFATRTNEDITLDAMHNVKLVSTFDLLKRQAREATTIDIVATPNNVVDDSQHRDCKVFSDITFNGNNSSKYLWNAEDKTFEFYTDASNSTVLLKDIKAIWVCNLNTDPVENNKYSVTHVTLLFEFENQDPMQLTISCRNK